MAVSANDKSKRWRRPSALDSPNGQEMESAEAVAPRATSREIPDGLTTRERLNLAGRTRPSVVLSRSDEADRLSIWQRLPWQRKNGCFVR
jgi:hypothetical protein